MTSVSAVIVAGGRGTRLGLDKAALCLADETPLLRVMTARLALVASEIIVVAGGHERCARMEALHRRATPDGLWATPPLWEPDDALFPASGPLGGLYAGLCAARGDAVLAVGCDMPYLDPAALRSVVDSLVGHDIAIPRAGEQLQPLHAVYRRAACLPAAERLLRAGSLALRGLCQDEALRVLVLDAATLPGSAGGPSWRGVNTPAELAAAGLRPMPAALT